MNKKKMIIHLFMIIVLVFVISVIKNLDNNDLSKKDKSIGVEENNPLLQYFIESHPANEVILCGYEDVNNDEMKDLIVIYNISKNKNGMLVVISNDDKYICSNEVFAPAENQAIKFKNIDDKEEMEFIISGSKNGQVGYGIFRLENVEIINLFGEGMEDCC